MKVPSPQGRQAPLVIVVIVQTYSATSEQGVHEEKSAPGMPERFIGVSSVTLVWVMDECTEVLEMEIVMTNRHLTLETLHGPSPWGPSVLPPCT
jgi:hypothetical protein